MAEYNEQQQKLTIKVVYYGPALSGKTTNLMTLHDLLSPELKGEMMTLETKNDRTLFFDFLPQDRNSCFKIGRLDIRYEPPAETRHKPLFQRRNILRGTIAGDDDLHRYHMY